MREAAAPPALSPPPADLPLRVLYLEQQVDSYQRLHAAELEELRRAVTQLRAEVLGLLRQPLPAGPGEEAPTNGLKASLDSRPKGAVD